MLRKRSTGEGASLAAPFPNRFLIWRSPGQPAGIRAEERTEGQPLLSRGDDDPGARFRIGLGSVVPKADAQVAADVRQFRRRETPGVSGKTGRTLELVVGQGQPRRVAAGEEDGAVEL